jgi:hypothetical protein
MKTNLLREAIADADAIKKLAIENAKAGLNEAFDTKIRSLLTARLEEEVDEDIYEEDNMDDEAPKKKAPKEKPEEDDDTDEGFNIDEILAELEEGGHKDDEDEGGGKDEEEEEGEDPDEAYELDEDDEYLEEDDMGDKYMDEEDDMDNDLKEKKDDDINLEALLAEMENDEEGYDEGYEEGYGMEDEGYDPEDEDAMEEEMVREVMRVIKERKAASKKSKSTDDIDDEEEPEEPSESEKDMKKQLQEIKRQAKVLTQKVNETNLINAKLLYLNKILRKHNLSEQQKIKVIGAFDKAETINEAKIVHESLSQAFSVKNDTTKTGLKESMGFASSAAGTSTKRVINEGVISGVDAQVSRWQKLAGIIK